VIESHSPDETRALGDRLGKSLEAGDVLFLAGELGAGKTLFVQGLARGLGFTGPVSSKSFVIMGEYAGRVKLYHADLYRLDDPGQVQDLALEETTLDGVLAVEWPERGAGVLGAEGLHIYFEVLGETTRRLQVQGVGDRGEALANALEGRA
jgi:tRNA threonylcarbamoyladenosine biosynthesis protein TsaE